MPQIHLNAIKMSADKSGLIFCVKTFIISYYVFSKKLQPRIILSRVCQLLLSWGSWWSAGLWDYVKAEKKSLKIKNNLSEENRDSLGLLMHRIIFYAF